MSEVVSYPPAQVDASHCLDDCHNHGILDLIAALDDYFPKSRQRDLWQRKTIEEWQARLVRMLREHFLEYLLNPDYAPLLEAYASAVAERRVDPMVYREFASDDCLPCDSAAAVCWCRF